ncbi:MAG TPA: V-type ATP synthase subunit E [Spirochaetia bacterium]|nr:V-type ATP synthase subunit E [Spirochaetia bacterium]
MDVQLKELIETIKKEGVHSAEERAAEIVKAAEKKSADMVDHAQKEAERIIAKAKEEAARAEQSGKDALKQAGRDLLLNLRGSITKVFDSVIRQETGNALHGKILEESIVTLLKSWDGATLGKLDVVLAPNDLSALESSLRARLAGEMSKGVEIKANPGAKAGFRITEKDGNAYYDFTAEGIAEVLSEYLSPRLAELIQSQGSAT